MRYILAIICPPLAVLFCGKIFQFFFSIILTMIFWIPGVIHALFVVSNHLADVRQNKLIKAMKKQRR